MSRLIIISNRLPVSVIKQKGKFVYEESVGGVATGIASLDKPKDRLWFGWAGIPADKLKETDQTQITKDLEKIGCCPVFLNNRDIRDFYSGFSNKTIWPLFHYFSEFAVFDQVYWEAYKKVNQHFCDTIVGQLKKKDIIWIHDYQLMLLPSMIRKELPKAQIGFFHHIPFPSFELLRHMPWRTEILEGLLGADLVGFHEYDYVRHFLSSVHRICGYEHHLSRLVIGDRQVRVDAFPMGINYDKYANSSTNPQVQKEIEKIDTEKTRMILSVDRLDYTKGILNRLEAYDEFLKMYPEYAGTVKLVMVATPSRTKVSHYSKLREQIEQLVGRINGEHGTVGWTPVSYLYRSLPFEQITALYNVADVALITPLRDGMNLVAKEFVAVQKSKEYEGILILSEMAGAASELSEAVVINPHDKPAIVEAIKNALEMDQDERKRRNKLMQSRISRYTVGRWAMEFIHGLENIKTEQEHLATTKFSDAIQDEIASDFAKAKNRLILLDYDGTLRPFTKVPSQAKPDDELTELLERLCGDEKNNVVIISGRDKYTLEEWLGKLEINLVAEHGAFYRFKNEQWQAAVQDNNEWKDAIRPILELSVDRTPGSFIEEKTSALVWHFRKSEPDLAKLRTHELKDTLLMMASNFHIGVFEGNKIIEVKPVTINKGQAVHLWLDKDRWDFVFCVGDDYTDEDMFAAIPESGVTCKIGAGPSNAKFKLANPEQLRRFLGKLEIRD